MKGEDISHHRLFIVDLGIVVALLQKSYSIISMLCTVITPSLLLPVMNAGESRIHTEDKWRSGTR